MNFPHRHSVGVNMASEARERSPAQERLLSSVTSIKDLQKKRTSVSVSSAPQIMQENSVICYEHIKSSTNRTPDSARTHERVQSTTNKKSDSAPSVSRRIEGIPVISHEYIQSLTNRTYDSVISHEDVQSSIEHIQSSTD